MKNRILFFTLLLFIGITLQAQIPTNLISLMEDSPIKKVLLTDLNNDDIKEILVLREDDDIIVYYPINGDYVREIYLEVDQPLFMGYDDLNRDGGSDLYYSAASFNGIKMKYGETGSPYELDETSFGEDELEGIVDGAFIEFEFDNFTTAGIALIGGDGDMHIYNTFASSFFILGAAYVSTIPVSAAPGQMAFAGSKDFGVLSLTNQIESRIENYTLEGGQFSLAVKDTQFIESYGGPYGVAGKRLDDDKLELFITDKETNSFISSPDIDPIIIDNELEEPGKIYIYDVDGDGDEEVYVEDGKKVYRYDDLVLRSAKELFFEAAQPIKDMIIGDIDGDELTDVILIEEGSNEISILTHALVSVKDQKSIEIEVFPNPSSDFLNIKAENTPSLVYITDMQGKKNTFMVDQQRVDISTLTPGRYLLSYRNDGISYSTSFIKTNN